MLGKRVYLFVFLIFVNFVIGLFITDYGIELLNFIALEWFGKERFYVYDTKNADFGIYIYIYICVCVCGLH
ncbi:hypothetical protein CQA53_00065 [Helicobacter didelphidarum]|uniref:Uncharacterized protein n=1 Tax=Helicobacter didelphidarum TaxID=2040648 RepID=A0A3D8IS78_9HELI|nr:hypothetical protein [Helicobacter didelphidarum]RDU67464.1 hypothetical protein CQA53_00065 [Helicobacter didelphidarum]